MGKSALVLFHEEQAFRQWPVDPGLLNTPQLAAFLSRKV